MPKLNDVIVAKLLCYWRVETATMEHRMFQCAHTTTPHIPHLSAKCAAVIIKPLFETSMMWHAKKPTLAHKIRATQNEHVIILMNQKHLPRNRFNRWLVENGNCDRAVGPLISWVQPLSGFHRVCDLKAWLPTTMNELKSRSESLPERFFSRLPPTLGLARYTSPFPLPSSLRCHSTLGTTLNTQLTCKLRIHI